MNISKIDKVHAAEALRGWFDSQELDGADAVMVCLEFVAMCTALGAHSWPEASHALKVASREMVEATSYRFLYEELKRLKAKVERQARGE